MSRQAQTAKSQKTSFSIDPRYIGRLVGTLTGICLVVALLLGIVPLSLLLIGFLIWNRRRKK